MDMTKPIGLMTSVQALSLATDAGNRAEQVVALLRDAADRLDAFQGRFTVGAMQFMYDPNEERSYLVLFAEV